MPEELIIKILIVLYFLFGVFIAWQIEPIRIFLYRMIPHKHDWRGQGASWTHFTGEKDLFGNLTHWACNKCEMRTISRTDYTNELPYKPPPKNCRIYTSRRKLWIKKI